MRKHKSTSCVSNCIFSFLEALTLYFTELVTNRWTFLFKKNCDQSLALCIHLNELVKWIVKKTERKNMITSKDNRLLFLALYNVIMCRGANIWE